MYIATGRVCVCVYFIREFLHNYYAYCRGNQLVTNVLKRILCFLTVRIQYNLYTLCTVLYIYCRFLKFFLFRFAVISIFFFFFYAAHTRNMGVVRIVRRSVHYLFAIITPQRTHDILNSNLKRRAYRLCAGDNYCA